MSINPLSHYSLENIPSIYDEEAMTALELCARTASKVNECVTEFNRLEKDVQTELPAYVDKWLKDHPEVTTNVMDGSLTPEKFTKALQLLTIKGYTVPQLFGAVGMGDDDTKAFQSALDTGAKLYVPKGTYKITGELTAYNSIFFDKDALIEFYPSAQNESCIHVSGKSTPIATAFDCSFDGNVMTASDLALSTLQAGDYVYLSNNELASPHGRSYDTKRDILQVLEVGFGTVTFTYAPVHAYSTCNMDRLDMVDNIIIDGAKIRCMETVAGCNGITLSYCKNGIVRNCHIVNFDCAQVNFEYCVLTDAHSNLCEVDYSNGLQYGIIALSCHSVAIYGNKVNSQRTAIDVTRLSNKVSVAGNTTIGSINTHSAHNVVISGNTITDGMILIRGKNITATDNNVTNYNQTTIDIEEMGMEGGHIITGNIFKGYCSMKCYQSNVVIKNNHFIVEKVLEYTNSGGTAFSSVIRFMLNSQDSELEKKDGAVIEGNTFEAVGITPNECIECASNTRTARNIVVRGNVIRGFATGLNMVQSSTVIGENLIIKDNLMVVTKQGVKYRLVNNVQIIGNTIVALEKGTKCVEQITGGSEPTEGLIIKDNYIKNFANGVYIYGVNAVKSYIVDNIYCNCDTAETGLFRTEQQTRRLLVASPNGTVYEIKVDDAGAITATAKSYTT